MQEARSCGKESIGWTSVAVMLAVIEADCGIEAAAWHDWGTGSRYLESALLVRPPTPPSTGSLGEDFVTGTVHCTV